MEPTTEPSSSDPVDPIELTASERHAVLASKRRRIVLEVLEDRRLPVTLEDIASAVAELEGDAEEDIDGRIAISLFHNHLPRMDAAGVLDFDPDAQRVESLSWNC